MNFTTIERLYENLPATGNIIPFQSWVIEAVPTYLGTSITIYEIVDDLKDCDLTEARLSSIITSEDFFKDQGEGIKWAFKELEK